VADQGRHRLGLCKGQDVAFCDGLAALLRNQSRNRFRTLLVIKHAAGLVAVGFDHRAVFDSPALRASHGLRVYSSLFACLLAAGTSKFD